MMFQCISSDAKCVKCQNMIKSTYVHALALLHYCSCGATEAEEGEARDVGVGGSTAFTMAAFIVVVVGPF